MKRVEAYHILHDMWKDANEKQREAIEIAQNDIEFVDLMPDEYKKVKHGRWMPQRLLGAPAWDCSECKTLGSPHWKWCPWCGARMYADV